MKLNAFNISPWIWPNGHIKGAETRPKPRFHNQVLEIKGSVFSPYLLTPLPSGFLSIKDIEFTKEKAEDQFKFFSLFLKFRIIVRQLMRSCISVFNLQFSLNPSLNYFIPSVDLLSIQLSPWILNFSFRFDDPSLYPQ